jgi:hypothetical protein
MQKMRSFESCRFRQGLKGRLLERLQSGLMSKRDWVPFWESIFRFGSCINKVYSDRLAFSTMYYHQ